MCNCIPNFPWLLLLCPNFSKVLGKSEKRLTHTKEPGPAWPGQKGDAAKKHTETNKKKSFHNCTAIQSRFCLWEKKEKKKDLEQARRPFWVLLLFIAKRCCCYIYIAVLLIPYWQKAWSLIDITPFQHVREL